MNNPDTPSGHQNGRRFGRHAAIRARSRILEYFLPRPNEVALKKDEAAFDRAKADWLKHARIAITEVEELDYAEFLSLRDNFKGRKSTECPHCGQTYSEVAAGETCVG